MRQFLWECYSKLAQQTNYLHCPKSVSDRNLLKFLAKRHSNEDLDYSNGSICVNTMMWNEWNVLLFAYLFQSLIYLFSVGVKSISSWDYTQNCTLTGWDSMGRVVTKKWARAFQTLGRAFSFLLNPWKLGRVF